MELMTTVMRATALMISRNWVASSSARGHAEIVGLIEGDVAPAAKHATNFVLGFGFLAGVGERAEEVLVVGGIVLAVGVIGNHDFLVGVIVAEELCPYVSRARR